MLKKKKIHDFYDLFHELKKIKKNIFYFPIQKINLTGSEFVNCLLSLDRMFKELKLKKNSKVAIKFDNSIEYTLLSFFFILKGFVLIPINPKLKKNEINEILQISKSKIFFF
jgi:long-subunit acyl-CoA synthetase (AMP-forming)